MMRASCLALRGVWMGSSCTSSVSRVRLGQRKMPCGGGHMQLWIYGTMAMSRWAVSLWCERSTVLSALSTSWPLGLGQTPFAFLLSRAQVQLHVLQCPQFGALRSCVKSWDANGVQVSVRIRYPNYSLELLHLSSHPLWHSWCIMVIAHCFLVTFDVCLQLVEPTVIYRNVLNSLNSWNDS